MAAMVWWPPAAATTTWCRRRASTGRGWLQGRSRAAAASAPVKRTTVSQREARARDAVIHHAPTVVAGAVAQAAALPQAPGEHSARRGDGARMVATAAEGRHALAQGHEAREPEGRVALRGEWRDG